jgi:DNA-binding response OmpR family regulator
VAITGDERLLWSKTTSREHVLERGLGVRAMRWRFAYTRRGARAERARSSTTALLLDVRLPHGRFAVCETLRRRERWMPVLMLTARTDVSDRIRRLDAGADDY